MSPSAVDVASSLAFYFLFPAFAAYSTEAGVVTRAFWNREQVRLPQSANLSVTCSVVGADLYDVIRVVHSYGAKTLLLADNNVVGPAFRALPRYHVTYRNGGNTALVTVNINGVRGEDTGILACQQINNDDIIAYADVTVYVPVSEVHVTSISSDGNQSPVETDADVYLQQGTTRGVGCVATSIGSRIPPAVGVRVGDRDVTAEFNSTADVETPRAGGGGLTFYRVVVRLAHVTSRPDRRLHGKRLVCTASRPGFDDVSAASPLVVRYAPVVTCQTDEYSVVSGSNVTLTCTVSANPSSRITWSAVVQSHDDFYRVLDDTSVSITSSALTETESSLSLHIVDVDERHDRNYTALARNGLGSDSGVVRLTVTTPPGQSTTQRPVDDGRRRESSVIARTTPTTSIPTAAPSPTSTSSSTSTSTSIRWRRRTTMTTKNLLPHRTVSITSPAAVSAAAALSASSVVVIVFVVAAAVNHSPRSFRRSSFT